LHNSIIRTARHALAAADAVIQSQMLAERSNHALKFSENAPQMTA
jgi:hypothetical protein